MSYKCFWDFRQSLEKDVYYLTKQMNGLNFQKYSIFCVDRIRPVNKRRHNIV